MGLLDAFKNTNIFGARKPTYLEGIATPEQIKQAEQQSLVQGLLGTAVGYLAQPKNQGYGSAVPYLAKGYLQGMESAQTPYQGLERDVLMTAKFQDIKREQELAQQKRQMTEQLLNDPRVQGNPLYESMAVNAPADLFKELEKVTVIREGGKAIKGSTGEVIAESPKAPKPPEDKRSQLERMIDIYNSMDDTDPRKKVYGDYIKKQTTETSKSTTKTPSKPTNVDTKNVQKIADQLLNVDVDSGEAAVIASRANKKMADEGISFDEAVISIIEEVKGIKKPVEGPFGITIPFTGGGQGINKEKLLSPNNDNWKIEKIS
jgi:hypothetical protein